MTEEFDEDWAKNFKSKINSHAEKSKIFTAIDSLVDCRNEFAHGGNPNLSVYDVINYFNDAKILLHLLDEVVI
jgi:hypothetical protein